SFLLFHTIFVGDPPDMATFFVFVGALMAINIAVEPNSSALALEPMGDVAGIATAVYGTCFFFIGSTLGSIISNLMVKGVFPMIIGFFLIGVFTLLLVFKDYHKTKF